MDELEVRPEKNKSKKVLESEKIEKGKRKIPKVVFLLGLLVLIIISFWLLIKTVLGLGFSDYVTYTKDFIFTPYEKIVESNGRTNILILGKSGKGYTAPDLTDTMIVASVSLTKPSVVLVSIPRDIWVPEIRAKLNSAYYWGKQKGKTEGISLAKSSVEKILGQPIHYGLVVDFSSFIKIIDVLDGVEVGVERSFVDEKYPIVGKENDLCNGDKEYRCRYETVKFEKGLQKMDGVTALEFVRSRNAEGEEGTDFAREARQQKVIAAIKNKLLSFQTLTSLEKLRGIWIIIEESVETDMNSSAAMILSRKFLEARNNIQSFVFPQDLLLNPPISSKYDNQYVFIPKGEGWKEVWQWIDKLLKP